MAESLASAVPVITTPFGAAPEIVTHRRTGFLCSSDEISIEAAEKINEIDRSLCRADAVKRFSVERMAQDHVDLYTSLLTHGIQQDKTELPEMTGRDSRSSDVVH